MVSVLALDKLCGQADVASALSRSSSKQKR